MSNKPIEPPAIDSSPIDVDVEGDQDADSLERALEEALEQIGDLTASLSAAEAQIERLDGKSDIEAVKARMLEPYVNKVFNFVAIYCGIVGAFLFLHALQIRFELPEPILAIIAGSTAVSVIGLIGLVITGLFGGKRK